MSDSDQQPGWWLASDGKWYPPPAPDPPRESATVFVPLVGSDQPVMPIDVGGSGPPAFEGSPVSYPERPPYLPAGVAPPAPGVSPNAGPGANGGPPVDWPLYEHPILPAAQPETAPDPHNRLIGGFIVVAAVVAVGASLLPWVSFDGGPVGGDSSGWFRGEGKVTLVAGVVLAGAGGAIAGGAKRLWIKLVAMTAAVVIIGVFTVDVVDISAEADALVEQGTPVDLDQAYGLWMLGAAGVTAFVLTLVERTPWTRRSD